MKPAYGDDAGDLVSAPAIVLSLGTDVEKSKNLVSGTSRGDEVISSFLAAGTTRSL